MNISIKLKLDFSKVNQTLKSDELWKFAATEWWRAYYDYVPHDTNRLRQSVHIRPKEIEHYAPYSLVIYKGIIMVDPQYKVGGFPINGGVDWFSRRGIKKVASGRQMKLKNGSRLWDVKARQDKKDLIVVKSMQGWIEKNL